MKFEELTGVQKLAILISRLNNDTFQQLFSSLPNFLIQQVIAQQKKLTIVPIAIVNKVLQEYYDIIAEENTFIFPQNISLEYIYKIAHEKDLSGLSHVFINQTPQIQAIILASVNPNLRVTLLKSLKDSEQAEVLTRLGHLKNVSQETLKELNKYVEESLSHLGPVGSQNLQGSKQADSLLRHLDPMERKKILGKIGDQIHYSEKIWSDLLNYSVVELQNILKKIPRKTLLIALRKTDQNVLDHILASLSQRNQQVLIEDVAAIGPQKLSDVLKAQEEILQSLLLN